MSKVFIIAEAGDNHDGHQDRALTLVDIAARAGADAVKFQTFRAEEILCAGTPMADYQIANTGSGQSQLDMIRSLELPAEAWAVIARRCAGQGIEFLSTPFDVQSLDMLLDLGIKRIKMPSGEISNAPLLLRAGSTGLPVMLSTGMANLGEIEEALGVLAFGMLDAGKLDNGEQPSRAAFQAAYRSVEGQALLAERVTLLHCTSEYPAPLDQVNLRAMTTMGQAFGLPVGYSDHTKGLTVPVAATALGALVVEKHFTLDPTLPGPDHAASASPEELEAMVKAIREAHASLGDGRKRAMPAELGNRPLVRRALVAARPIKAGEALTPENLTAKRCPEQGISPLDYYDRLGTIADRDYDRDEPIR